MDIVPRTSVEIGGGASGRMDAGAHAASRRVGARLDRLPHPAGAPIEKSVRLVRLNRARRKIASARKPRRNITARPCRGVLGPYTPTPSALGFAKKQGVRSSSSRRVTLRMRVSRLPQAAIVKERRRCAAGSCWRRASRLSFSEAIHWDAKLEMAGLDCCSSGQSDGSCSCTGCRWCRFTDRPHSGPPESHVPTSGRAR